MLKTLLLSSIILSSIYSQALVTEPKNIVTAKTKMVNFGSSIQRLLKKKHPNFKPLTPSSFDKEISTYFKNERRLLPMSVVGDFNADKIKDVVVLGKNSSKYQILVFLSTTNGYKSFIHEEWSLADFTELYISKGKLTVYLSPALKKHLLFKDKKKRDAFHLRSFGTFVQLYYLHKGKFKAFKIGNKDLTIKN